jgi:O-antigen/teichoic acid export membrane protein
MNAYGKLYDRSFALIASTLRNRFFLWNLFGNIGPLLFALAAIPYIYAHSSREYVGFLTLTWAAIGYTGLFDFGLSRALFYFTSLSRTDPKIDIRRVIVQSTVFTILISIALNIALYFMIGRVANAFSLTGSDQITALFIIAATLPIYLVSNMFRSCLEGMELFKEANIFKFAAYLSLFACPAALVMGGVHSLAAVCALYSIVRLVACLYMVTRLLPRLGDRRCPPEQRVVVPMRKVLGFGGWATVSSTVSPLMVYGDRFAITYFSGAAAIAIYALLQEMIGKTILLSASYVTAIQPRMGYLPGPEAATLYSREHRNVALLSAAVYSACLLISPFFVAVWLHVGLAEVAFLAVVMSFGFMFNSMAQAPLAYLLARGQPRRVAQAHLVEMSLYFPALIGATMHYGVAGAAVIGVLRQIFDYGILSWQARRLTA